MADSKSKKGTKPSKLSLVQGPVKAGKANVAKSKQDRGAKAATVLAGETIPAMAEARDLALELIDDPDELAEGEEEVEK